MAEEQEQGNVRLNLDMGRLGMNMDNTPNQINQGVVTYALNAAVENFDANSVNYQNEPGNELCFDFPEGYHLIGTHFINEQNKHIFFLSNPDTGDSEIGFMVNNDCIYHTYINTRCLNFNIDYPIHKSVHKITNCTTEIYWTDGLNPRRYLDLNEPPYQTVFVSGACSPQNTPLIDCNKLKLQPNFEIPQLAVIDVINGGELKAGTYQFAIQYCDARGNGYTSYYSVTNPTPIANPQIATLNFDYVVGKSIELSITNIDITGYYEYINVAVIKTINNITSVELVGTYFIDGTTRPLTYTGQSVTDIRLSINDIFEKFPYYDVAQDLTAVQDILVWDNLTSDERVNYQKIANQIPLQWETWRIPANENYSDELNATNLRGYLRDEVYAFEIVFLLKNGKQTDGFHIPGRIKDGHEALPDVPTTNNDFIGEPEYYVGSVGYSPYWKIYNTGYYLGNHPDATSDVNYKGPWQYGGFAYWESEERYPCNTEVWGDLAGQPIRHHKFPDCSVTHIHESSQLSALPSFNFGNIFDDPLNLDPIDLTPTTYVSVQTNPVMTQDAVFPIGVKIDVDQIKNLIDSSNLTDEQKNDIVGFKIVRGDRSTNRSIVAKGILRNVGKYNRESTEYYYPNYPYNDLKVDPFLQNVNNAYLQGCKPYRVVVTSSSATIAYIDCKTNEYGEFLYSTGSHEFCALSFPLLTSGTTSYIGVTNYSFWQVTNSNPFYDFYARYINPEDPNGNYSIERICGSVEGFFSNGCNSKQIRSTIVPQIEKDDGDGVLVWRNLTCSGTYKACFQFSVTSPLNCGTSSDPELDSFVKSTDPKYRQVFNSPETSFGQPFLGNIIKLESVEYGAGRAHFNKVIDHAKYKLITKEAQQDALKSSVDIANLGGFSATAMFTCYQAYLQIYINGITRKNYAYSFNSIASYDYFVSVPNDTIDFVASPTTTGIKQRTLDICQYLIPGVQSVGENISINNYQRESSVYFRTDLTKTALPYPSDSYYINPGGSGRLISDDSRFVISEKGNCIEPEKLEDIKVVSYYGAIKNIFVNQWGQIYSYETIDTGFQFMFDERITSYPKLTVFGGDTFISKFAFKTKLPFFIDNRVGAPDDSDVFYDEIGNVAYPKYWFSSRSILDNYDVNGTLMRNIISYKATNFDCKNSQVPGPPAPNAGRTFYDGKMYLFAYGIPSFYCESSVNVDLRQAFNNREGDFWPHVSTGIPDDWLQEKNVSIAQDNTYYYNVTYSKQNKENYFSHLPVDWSPKLCYTYYPFRAIYSDVQRSYTDTLLNNWLIYRPVSFFDFPQNYGKLTSLDGIQNKNVLARFENKTLLYNNLLTIDTSNPQAAYIGNDKLFASAPPIDFAETDLGYVGSQNKFLLKIPQGQVTIDAKRGNVFLLTGEGARDLAAFGSGMNRFFTDHLAFEILRYFPKVNIDNHFKNIGLHGVYDSKYDRIIITKLDYVPLLKNIIFDETDQEFYLVETVDGTDIRTQIYVTDEEYFCNKSWSVSFNFNTMSWISFHSYQPNWFIGENNFFYSGLNGGCYIDAFAGEVLPNPTTTTSSTTISPCSCITFINYDEFSSIPAQYTDCDDNIIDVSVDPMTNGFPGTLRVCGSNPSIQEGTYHIDGPCQWFDPIFDVWECYPTTTLPPDPVIPPCAIVAFVTVLPGPTTSTTSSTSSTSSTSTTTTTTTICSSCSMYAITNLTSCYEWVMLTACNGESLPVSIDAGQKTVICLCSAPVLSAKFLVEFVEEGCSNNFCYTVTNGDTVAATVNYANSTSQYITVSLPGGQSLCTCAKYNSVSSDNLNVTISGGSTLCSSQGPCGPCGTPCPPGVITETMIDGCDCRIYEYSVPSLPSSAESLVWTIPFGSEIIEQTATAIKIKYSLDAIYGYVTVHSKSVCNLISDSISYLVNLASCTTTTTSTTCLIGGSSQVYISNNNTEGKGDSQIVYVDLDGSAYNVWSTPDPGTDLIPLDPGETYTGTQNMGGLSFDIDVRQDATATSFLKVYRDCKYEACEIIPNGTGNILVNVPVLLNPTDSVAVVLNNNPAEPFLTACSCDDYEVLIVNNAFDPAEGSDTYVNNVTYSGATLYSVTAGLSLPLANSGYSAGPYDSAPYSTGSVDVELRNNAGVDKYVSVYVNCVLIGCQTVPAASGDATYNFTTDLNIGDKLMVYYSSTPC